MFTVVITEQAHLDSIKQYQSFLKPFLDNAHIAFCPWNLEGKTLKEAVPTLYETVSRHEQWRMLVICDEEGLHSKNPFDLVAFHEPVLTKEMDEAAFRAQRRQARFAAYEEAATKPLVRLMTWLCQAPMASSGENNALALEDPEFAEYLAQVSKKAQLRSQILGDYIPEINLPAQILCVAKRCYQEGAQDINTSWQVNEGSRYSTFPDRNMYFEKMRYLVFDILQKTHRNYTFDYIRFLYAVMVLAEHEAPMGALNPGRVYALECENDEQALSALLGDYDSKLVSTQELLRAEVTRIQRTVKPRLEDRDAAAIFCSSITVPVNSTKNFNMKELFVSSRGLGLSADCPQSEAASWNSQYQNSRQVFGRYMKQPRRAVHKAISEMRRMDTADLETAARLNAYQIEDVEEYIAGEELKMIGTKTRDFRDMEYYTKDLEAQNKRTKTVIERRMTRKWTIILGAVALGCYLVSFIPMFTSNLKAEDGTLFSLLFILAGAGIMAAIALATLFFLRLPLKLSYGDYNGIMHGVVKDVEITLGEYSDYLSHACNMMRGHSVLNYLKGYEDPDAAKIRVLKKHDLDIQLVRERFHEVFGSFLPKDGVDVDPENSYQYNFQRAVEYSYPMPHTEDQRRWIEFMQPGNQVEIPVDFVKAIRIRREELYD